MKLAFSGVVLCVVTALLVSCKSLSPTLVGDPKKHGFVLLEGEATIRGVTEAPGGTRIAEIDSIALENVQFPNRTARGAIHYGRTWFSNIEPGTWRVKEIHVKGDPNEVTYRLPNDADPSALTFSVGAGELVYLGYVEIFRTRISDMTNADVTRIVLIRNRSEFLAWESIYDLYARTDWEPLVLKRMAETK